MNSTASGRFATHQPKSLQFIAELNIFHSSCNYNSSFLEDNPLNKINSLPLPAKMITKLHMMRFSSKKIFSDYKNLSPEEVFKLFITSLVKQLGRDLSDKLYDGTSLASGTKITDLLFSSIKYLGKQNALKTLPALLHLPIEVLENLMNEVKSYIMLNNILILAGAYGYKPLIKLCLEMGADDFENALKVAVVQRQSMVCNILTFGMVIKDVVPSRYKDTEEYDAYYARMTYIPARGHLIFYAKDHVEEHFANGPLSKTDIGRWVEDITKTINDWSYNNIFKSILHCDTVTLVELFAPDAEEIELRI